jgi:hypothetical protein
MSEVYIAPEPTQLSVLEKIEENTANLIFPELVSGNLPVAPNISRGSGVTDANTQRIVLASDSPNSVSLASIDAKSPALVSGASPVSMQVLGGTIPAYNNMLMSYTGTNLTTVQYRLNVAVVATVTMTYDASGNMLTATRS